MTVFRY